MKKFKLLLQVTAFLITLSGVLVNANTPESKFDENKSWNNMVWVTYGTHDGSGNPERNFTVKNEYGKELSFSLVETFDSTDAKYWIIANDRYGTKGTGTSPIYNPTAEGSIAKYVNEAFVQENAWEWNLPGSVIACLDHDHKWMTEKAYSGEKVSSAYEIEAAVVIPAVWEMEQYGENVMINFLPKYNSNYVFRTALSDTYYHGLKLNSVTASGDKYRFQLTPCSAGSAARGIRPEFFVNSDFFKTAAVDLSTAGKDILAEILKYSYEELSEIYSDEDIKAYLPSIEVPEPVATVFIETTDGKASDVGNTVKATVGGEAIKTETPLYSWYADGELIEGEDTDELILNYDYYEKKVSCKITIAGETVESNSLSVGGRFDPTTYANMAWVSIGSDNGKGDEDYDFEVDGKSFSLLRVYNNAKSRYFVIANDLYGSHSIGQTQAVYNPEESGSLAEYVNDIVAIYDGTSANTLPQAISEHINFNHVWKTENTEGTFKAGVAIPAIWEMVKFSERIKVQAGETYSQFVFRTPYNNTHYHALAVGESEQLQLNGGQYRWKLTPKNISGNGAIRPIFYLDADFFKTSKLDLEKTGEGIKEILKEECTREELLELYSEDELISGGLGENYTVDITWGNGSDALLSLEGVEKITASVAVISQMAHNQDMVLVMELFDENNNIVGMDAIALTALSDSTTYAEEDLELLNLSGVTEDYKLKIFIWDGIVSMKSLKSAVVYDEN